jgi:hypothetical protein
LQITSSVIRHIAGGARHITGGGYRKSLKAQTTNSGKSLIFKHLRG